MRRFVMVVTAVSVVVGSACIRTTREKETGKVDIDIESPTKVGEDWSAGLKGLGSHANLSGTVKALVGGGETNITISLAGGTPGTTMPWHIHQGKCGSGGPIVGEASAYKALTVGGEGKAEGNARTTVSLKEATDYYVDVHHSHADMATIVACGELDD